MNKEVLRKKYKKIRNNISNQTKKSQQITKKLINEKIYKEAKVIAIYSSIDSEVKTIPLAKIALNNKKTLAYPKIIDKNNMEFYKINCLEELKEGNFHILEPTSNKKIDKEKIDLIIIPGICFDLNKNRIGYGKGYYDSYLQGTNIKKVGICYEKQITTKTIITDKQDIKMDWIITEENIY